LEAKQLGSINQPLEAKQKGSRNKNMQVFLLRNGYFGEDALP
jgi:hypothetical protein